MYKCVPKPKVKINSDIKRKRGFTLLEVIVYVGVMSVIGGTVTALILQVYRFQTIVQDRAQLNEDIRILFKSIRDDMYLGDTMQVDGDKLIILSTFNSPATVTYSWQGSQVYRKENAGADVAITNQGTNVRDFGLEDISTPSSAGVVRVTLVMSNYPRNPLKPEVIEDVTSTMSLKFL